jgi:lysophospholipase L1-like esterase
MPLRTGWMPRVLRGAIALIGGIALAAIAAEIALRVLAPIQLRLRGTEIVLPVDTVTKGHNLNPTRLESEITVRRNSLGFRGPDPPADFARHLTLVAVGGSTTEDLFLTDGRTWTDLLAARLAGELRDTWLDNAGLDGHSTFGHLHLLDQMLLELGPDYVLFLIGVNDVDRDDANDFDLRVMHSQLGTWQRIVRASDLLSTLAVLRRTERARDLGVGHIPELELAHCELAHEDSQALEELFRRQSEVCLPRYRERVVKLIEIARGGGIEPILVTQPALYGSAVDPATGIDIGPLACEGWSAATRWKQLELVNDVTRSVGAERGVLVIELAHAMPKDSRLFYDWMHFSNRGADVVAGIVAEALIPYLRARHPELARDGSG